MAESITWILIGVKILIAFMSRTIIKELDIDGYQWINFIIKEVWKKCENI